MIPQLFDSIRNEKTLFASLVIRLENGSPRAINVVLYVVLVGAVVKICILLRLFHFITDRRHTSHTHS